MATSAPMDQLPEDWHEDFETAHDRMRLGRPPKYPWEDWLDGQNVYLLTRGDDYTCQTSSIIAMFQRRARDRGLVPHWAFKTKDPFGRPGETIAIWVTRPHPGETDDDEDSDG